MKKHVPRVLINREKVGEGHPELVRLGVQTGFNFGEGNYRDVFYKGDCDAGVEELCSLLGWADDLHQLIKDSQTPEHEAHNPMTQPSTL